MVSKQLKPVRQNLAVIIAELRASARQTNEMADLLEQTLNEAIGPPESPWNERFAKKKAAQAAFKRPEVIRVDHDTIDTSPLISVDPPKSLWGERFIKRKDAEKQAKTKRKTKKTADTATTQSWAISPVSVIRSDRIQTNGGSQCEACGSAKTMFRRITFERGDDPLPEDVKFLCDPCHAKLKPIPFYEDWLAGQNRPDAL
jgi:hypothetical protein